MIGFRVSINGGPSIVASQSDWAVLSAIVTAIRNDDASDTNGQIRVSLGGLSSRSHCGFAEHFRWPESSVQVGDVVEIEIIETENPNEPAKRYRSDREIEESPFTETELRELRYKEYLELKAEFETVIGNETVSETTEKSESAR
jgi:hypothetical protein